MTTAPPQHRRGRRARPQPQPVSKRDGPGRPPKISDDEVRRLVKEGHPVKHMASLLDVTVMTIYNRIHALKLPIPLAGRYGDNQQAMQVFDDFVGLTTIEDLADDWSMSIGGIRSRLSRAISLYFPHGQTPKTWLPKPKNLREIKVFNLITKNESLFDKPDEIFAQTAVPQKIIMQYLHRATVTQEKK